MTLGEKLRQLRIERGWTQKEVAERSGLDRRYISYLEQPQHTGNPSAHAVLALARTFSIKPEELYQAAGYIKEAGGIRPRPESPEDILDKLRLATPQSIPVYPWDAFPFHAGDCCEPLEYVYRMRQKSDSKSIEAYVVRGDCLIPKINDGDVIIVDREGTIGHGDFVACICDGGLHVLQVRRVAGAGELWLENNHGTFKFEDCQCAAPVIECIRRFK